MKITLTVDEPFVSFAKEIKQSPKSVLTDVAGAIRFLWAPYGLQLKEGRSVSEVFREIFEV